MSERNLFTTVASVADHVAAAHEQHLATAANDLDRDRTLSGLGLGRGLAELEHAINGIRLDNVDDRSLAHLFELARVWCPHDPRAAQWENTIRLHIQTRHDLDLPGTPGHPTTTTRTENQNP